MKPLRILGVHGVGNHQSGLDPDAAGQRLTTWWRKALMKNLSMPGEVRLEVAYYAHRLVKDTAMGDDDPIHLPQDVQLDILRWAKLLGAPQDTAQGRLTAPARAFIEWVAGKFGLDHKLAQIFITTFFREVHTYFHESERRAAAAKDVAAAIDRIQPDVIIAHSLGSVVAYEALYAHAHRNVELLITAGSPLAMPDIVFDRLRDPASRPPGVHRWINIADPGDIIAVPRNGISRAFTDVAADITDSIHCFDFHRATHYLQSGAITGALAGYSAQGWGMAGA